MRSPLHELQGDAKARYVAAMFARISRRYDLLNTLMSWGMHHRWRRLAALMATDGLSGMALDVATGTGDLALALARRPGIQLVVGVDFVPEMLALARRKARRRGVPVNFHLLQGDAMALPFPDNAFVCATCGFGIRNVADVSEAVAEMARVVRPGGRVIILEIINPEEQSLPGRLLGQYFRRVVPLLGRVVAREPEAYTYLPRSVDAFPSVGGLATLMEDAGLRGVRYRHAAMRQVAIHVGEKH